jgi:hypothetical protein
MPRVVKRMDHSQELNMMTVAGISKFVASLSLGERHLFERRGV